MPYWRLSSFYLFYFGALGALVPFWGLYLQDRGLSAAAIGSLMAILMGTKVVAPNLWGWIADRTGQRMPIVRLASLLSVIAFASIFWARGFWGIAAVMLVFSFFWNASLPQMEAITFNHLGRRVNRYARVRVWGSVGFIITVGLMGLQVDRLGTASIPYTVLALYIGIWISSLTVPDRGHAAYAEEAVSLPALLRKPEIAFFLVACMLMQMSHGAYYAFYSIYLEAAGYRNVTVGALWAFGVVVEVLVFIRMHWLLERFGARRVLIVSLLLATLRWSLIGLFVNQPAVQIFAQALHAATFGSFHAAAIHLTHHYFIGRTQGRGQALYSSLSFGAGGGIGALLAGWLWEPLGGATTFVLASMASALGALAAWRFVDRGRRW
jgi:PPP family 3-phenylpropionic acid transporter